MSKSEITALINLVVALLPLIEKGAIALLADIRLLLSAASSSTDATPEQLAQVQELLALSDAAQDTAYAAYRAMVAEGI